MATGTPDGGGRTIRLSSGEWAPYTGENLLHHGCDSMVVSEAFAFEGIKVEYTFFPWARSYQLAKDGTFDGTLEWADTSEHRASFYISADFTSDQSLVFFYRKDRPFSFHNLDDLSGKRLGVTSGYVYNDDFAAIRKSGKFDFEEASSDEANLRKLLAGRIDVFPLERLVGETILAAQFTSAERDQISDDGTPLSEFNPHVLLTKANPENGTRIALFDKGFSQLKANGRYAEIMQSCYH